MKAEWVPVMSRATRNPGAVVIHRGNDADDVGAHSAIDDVMGILDYCALYNPFKGRCGGHDCTVLLLIRFQNHLLT